MGGSPTGETSGSQLAGLAGGHTIQGSSLACVSTLPDALLCFVHSFLHGFAIVGPVPAVCRVFAAACSHERLCAYILARDFAPEEFKPLPRQPFRAADSRRVTLTPANLELTDLSADDTDDRVAVTELRAFATTVLGKGPVHIAHLAARQGRPSLLAWAARAATVQTAGRPIMSMDDVDGAGRSALMVAAVNNKPLTVATATSFCELEQHFHPNGGALHMAAYVGASEAAAELCQRGAQLESLNETYKQTPLHVACSRGHADTVRVLLEARADLAARDRDGLTAVRIAQMMRCQAAQDVLSLHAEEIA